METVMKADIFFFIAGIGFLVLFVLLAIALIYVIKTFKQIRSLIKKIDSNVDSVGAHVEEFLRAVQDNIVYRFFFTPSKKKKKNGGQKQ